MINKHQLKIVSLSESKFENFSKLVVKAHDFLFSPHFSSGLPNTKVTAILSNNFTESVHEAWELQADRKKYGEMKFTGERLGGQVVAKAVALNSEFTDVHVIFDAVSWPSGSEAEDLYGLNLVTHELSHVLIGCMRVSSGAMVNVNIPSQTPSDLARSIVRIATEEYRVDKIAGTLISQFGTVDNTSDGSSRPIYPPDIVGEVYRKQVIDIINSTIYPGLPDKVQAYRERQITIDEMWHHVLNITDQTMTLLAHCEAESSFMWRKSPLLNECATHPGSMIYLSPTWSLIIEKVREQGMDFLKLEECKSLEIDLLNWGEKSIMAFWSKLGLTFETYPNRNDYFIHVTSPKY